MYCLFEFANKAMHSLTGLCISSASNPRNYNTLSYSLMCNLHSMLHKLLYCFLELYLTQTLPYLLSLRYLIRFAVHMFSHNIHKFSLPENSLIPQVTIFRFLAELLVITQEHFTD